MEELIVLLYDKDSFIILYKLLKSHVCVHAHVLVFVSIEARGKWLLSFC